MSTDRTDAAAGWADLQVIADTLRHAAAPSSTDTATYGAALLTVEALDNAIARRRMAADSFTARNAAEHAALVREAGGEGLREALERIRTMTAGSVAATLVGVHSIADAALTSPPPAKEPDPIPNYAPRVEAPSAFMRGDFEPAKEPGAAEAGLTADDLIEAALTEAVRRGVTSNASFAQGAEWAAQRHPAPGRGGEAALREALELAEDVLSRAPFSTEVWPNGMHPNTGIEIIRAALARLDAPPRAAAKERA